MDVAAMHEIDRVRFELRERGRAGGYDVAERNRIEPGGGKAQFTNEFHAICFGNLGEVGGAALDKGVVEAGPGRLRYVNRLRRPRLPNGPL